MNPTPPAPPPIDLGPRDPSYPPPGYSGYKPPPATLARAACGPLLLITLGVLLAVDHAGSTSFGRTWPVLLILFSFTRAPWTGYGLLLGIGCTMILNGAIVLYLARKAMRDRREQRERRA